MQFLFIALLLFAIAYDTHAHVPNVITQSSLQDIITIEDPELSQAYYGDMMGFPHTYEIRAKDPFHLFVEVLVPDIPAADERVSGIIIKEVGYKGRVVEVARLPGAEAGWESFYEPWGGDRYRRGASFEQDVEAGVYRIEVNTPENLSKYVLVVGKREDFGSVGYFETIGRIADVKAFFGKSRFRIVESPFVYVPLMASVFVSGVWLWWRRRSTVYRV